MADAKAPTYTGIFNNVRTIGQLLAGDRLKWQTELPVGAPSLPFMLHLSCFVHYTPHIPLLAQQILERIGIDCPILGGPENCCGAIHVHMGDAALGEQAARIGIGGFRRARPTTILSVCPDCDEMFAQFMPKIAPFRHSNISEIFVEQLAKLKSIMRPVNRRVMIHSHDSNTQRQRDKSNIETVLRAIPGLEIVETKHAAGIGPHCQILAPMPPPLQDAMFDEAVARGVDTLIVPYHSCYRQHLKCELRWRVNVQHYISLIGESLGLHEEEEYKKLRLLDNVDDAVEMLRPRFEPLGYTPEQVRPLIEWAVYC
jgi:Fe-S oxidoreductase